MASVVSQCDICQSRGSNKEAVVWCSECEELLCSECKEHHGISKSSRNHATLTVDDYQHLPSYVLSAKDQCHVHDNKYEFYCPSHDNPCCIQCMQQIHRNCQPLFSLSEVVANIKTSTMMKDLETVIDDLRNNFKSLIEKCNESSETLTKSMEKCKTEINELRETVNAHFTKIENQILQEISDKYTQCLTSKVELIKDLKEAENKVQMISNDILNIRKYASDTKTFLGLREIEKRIKEDKSFMESVLQKTILNQTELTVTVSPAIFYITNDFTLLGKLSVVETPMDLTMERKNEKGAQIVKTNEINIHQYSITQNSTITIPAGRNPLRMTGCSVVPTGEIILADKNNDRLLVFSTDGQLRKELSVIGNPVDVAYIGTTKVAVSIANKPKIKIKNIETGATCHKFILPGAGYGVSISGDKIVVRIKDSSFLVTDISGKHGNLVDAQEDCILYVVYYNEKFFYTKWNFDKVVCCDLAGKTLWEFQKDFLKKPCGLSMDRDGNIFVSGFESNNVVLISEDGKRCRELINKSYNLNSPAAISYNTESKQLAVVNLNDGHCCVFELDH